MSKLAFQYDTVLMKLTHPLLSIRIRAMNRLKVHLGMQATSIRDQEVLQNILKTLMQTLEDSELAKDALGILEMLLSKLEDKVLGSLDMHAFGEKLHCASASHPVLLTQAKRLYEKAFMKLSTMDITREEKLETDSIVCDMKKDIDEMLVCPPKNGEPDTFATQGWKFPEVSMIPADQQYLLEFQVKLRICSSAYEIVEMCEEFCNNLILNFPVPIFLQQPDILEYFTHLIFLPNTDDVSSKNQKSSMTFSYDVFYFDAIHTSPFHDNKICSTSSVVLASLNAIEAFIHACVAHVTWSPINPLLCVYDSALRPFKAATYNCRNVFYPQASKEQHECEESGVAWSHEGLAIKLFIEFIPLITSQVHPQVRILNLLHACVPLLPGREQTIPNSRQNTSISPLACKTYKFIFAELERALTVLLDHRWSYIRPPVLWRLLQLICKLLTTFEAHEYGIFASKESEITSGTQFSTITENNISIATPIHIPLTFWRQLQYIVITGLQARKEDGMNEDNLDSCTFEDLYTIMIRIDAGVKTYYKALVASQESKSKIEFFIRTTNDMMHLPSVSVNEMQFRQLVDSSLLVSQTLSSLDESDRLQAKKGLIWLFSQSYTAMPNINRPMRDTESTLLQLFRQAALKHLQMSCSNGNADVNGFLPDLLDLSIDIIINHRSAHALLRNCLEDDELVGLILIHLTSACSICDENSCSLWNLTDKLLEINVQILQGSDNDVFVHKSQSRIPILQHLAYFVPPLSIDISKDVINKSVAAVQGHAIDLLNLLEKTLSLEERLLAIARCLFHLRKEVRIATASKLYHLLDIFEQCETNNDLAGFFDPFFTARNRIDIARRIFGNVHASALSATEEVKASTKLNTIRHFCQILRSQPRESQIYESSACLLMNQIADMSETHMQIIEQTEEIMEILQLAEERLLCKGPGSLATLEISLQFIFVLSRQSIRIRQNLRGHVNMMKGLAKLIFHPDEHIKALLFPTLLVLTCSAEMFTYWDSRHTIQANIPSFLIETFGLQYDKWERLFSLKLMPMKAYVAAEEDKSYQLCQNFRILPSDLSSHMCLQKDLLDSVNQTIEALSQAKNASAFLDTIAYLHQLIPLHISIRKRLVGEWHSLFKRFLRNTPSAPKDFVVISAIIGFMDALCLFMSSEALTNVLVLVQNHIIPIFEQTSCPCALQNQMLRLFRRLLRGDSSICKTFISILVSTRLLKTVLCRLSLIKASNRDTRQAGLLLDICMQCITVSNNSDLQLLKKDLISLLPVLNTISMQQRKSGSFQQKSTVHRAIQLQFELLRTLQTTYFLEDKIESPSHDHARFWSMRLLFDSNSYIRYVGFAAAADIQRQSAGNSTFQFRDSKLLQLAFDTYRDGTECDLVRSEACDFLLTSFLRCKGSSDAQQSFMSIWSSLTNYAETSVANTCAAFMKWLLELIQNDRFLIKTVSSSLRLARFAFVMHREQSLEGTKDNANVCNWSIDTLLMSFGDAHEQSKVFLLLVEMLSMRKYRVCYSKWLRKYTRTSGTSIKYRQIRSSIWNSSLLSCTMLLVQEILRFFQVFLAQTCSPSVHQLLLNNTALPLYLVDLIGEISLLLVSTSPQASTERCLRYQTIQEAGKTLILLMHAEMRREGASLSRLSLLKVMINPCHRLLKPELPMDIQILSCRLLSLSALRMNCQEGLLDSYFAEQEGVEARVLRDTLFLMMQKTLTLETAFGIQPTQEQALLHPSVVACICALAENSQFFSELVSERIPWLLKQLRSNFSHIRILGGFSGKIKKSGACLEPQLQSNCHRIHSTLLVLRSLLYHHKLAQRSAREFEYYAILRDNWSTLKSAQCCGTFLMKLALEVLANYIECSDENKATIVFVDKETGKSLLTDCSALFMWLQSNSLHTVHVSMEELVHLLGAVLASAMLNDECIQAGIKSKFITQLCTITHMASGLASSSLNDMFVEEALLILGNVATHVRGSTYICQVLSTMALKELISETISDEILPLTYAAALFIRNLAFAKCGHGHFLAIWEHAWSNVCVCLQTAYDERHLQLLLCLSGCMWALWLIADANDKREFFRRTKRLQLYKLLHEIYSECNAAVEDHEIRQETARNIRNIQKLTTFSEASMSDLQYALLAADSTLQ